MLDDAGAFDCAEPACTTRGERIVVFGGLGFAGRAISRILRDRGYGVTTAQRGRHAPLNKVESTTCDARRIEDVRRVSEGAAGLVSAVLADSDGMLAATRNIAQVARETGARLVHLSTMSVYGDVSGNVPETATLGGTTSYARAKIACEMALDSSNATILRPGLIYGPGDEQWTGRLFRLLRSRRLGDLGEHGDGRCNCVFAADLGRAVAEALRNSAAEGLTINVAHPDPPRWNSMLILAACAIGAVPIRRKETWQLQLEAKWFAPPLFALKRALRPLRLQRHPRFLPDAVTSGMLRLFEQDFWLDQTRADRLLAFQHLHPAKALHECACWFTRTYGM